MSTMLHGERPLEADWRFAGLIARAVTEPGLGERYAADPHSVLAEYGLTVGPGQDTPALPRLVELELIVEQLDVPGTATRGGVCVHDAPARGGVCVNDLTDARVGVCVNDLAPATVGVCVNDLAPATVGVCVNDLTPAVRPNAAPCR